ncbi:redoxin domain-containing protein [Candidatus Bipolaricaulota bacterium]|nr:redoxin domain-containing protein [Candidatus Bipolaricaulota bacterium]TFH08870.1 MAG: redoxin domain-containing protein [Candidatus Atribacteria bacterium]
MKHRYNPILILVGLMCVFVFASANTPPVASFDFHSSGDGSQTTLILDATPSHDPDGTITSYQWLYGDGYSGSGATKAHTFPSVSTYTVTLLVTDDGGASHLTSQTIDLAAPVAPLVSPAQDVAPASASAAIAIPYDIPIGNRAGERAPAFALLDQEGQTVTLSDFLGHVVLVEFWSSSCSACQAAMPHVEALREEFADRGLVVITITINRNVDGEWQYLAQNGFTQFIALRELDPVARPTKEAYGISVIPHAFLIDPRGVIFYSGHVNYVRSDMIESLF